MTLENLVQIGKLKPHKPTREEITKLLAAARRNLKDAHVKDVSTETRFDAAYRGSDVVRDGGAYGQRIPTLNE